MLINKTRNGPFAEENEMLLELIGFGQKVLVSLYKLIVTVVDSFRF